MTETFKAAVVQAAPEFMDLEGCIDKARGLVERAAQEGARLVAFSECWFPGYPWWIWLSATAHNIKYFQAYHEKQPGSRRRGLEELRRMPETTAFSFRRRQRTRSRLALHCPVPVRRPGRIAAGTPQAETHPRRAHGVRRGQRQPPGCAGHRTGQYRPALLLGAPAAADQVRHVQHARAGAHRGLALIQLLPPGLLPGPEGKRRRPPRSMHWKASVLCSPLRGDLPEMIDLLVETGIQASLIRGRRRFRPGHAPDGSPMCEPLPKDQDGLLFAEPRPRRHCRGQSFRPIGRSLFASGCHQAATDRSPQPRVAEFLAKSGAEAERPTFSRSGRSGNATAMIS